MPLVLIAVVALVAAGVVSLSGYLALRKWLKQPHRVAFIGRSDAGKSTLLHFLEHGEIPQSGLPPTTGQRSERVTVGNLEVEVIDSGGDRLRDWVKGMDSADTIVYFFDAAAVASCTPEALSNLVADAGHMKALAGKAAPKKRFVIVGTHSDLFSNRKDDEKTVRKCQEVQQFRAECGVDDGRVVIGSLAANKDAAKLAGVLAKRVSR